MISPASHRTAETLEAELKHALAANDQRFTRQRLLVYQFLAEEQAHGHHPTAEDVFRGVRRRVPAISLATVYKALEALQTCGLIRKLSFGNDRAHYDFRVDEHHHARDLRTGDIIDIEGGGDPRLLAALKKPKGFRVVRCHIELEGYFEEASG